MFIALLPLVATALQAIQIPVAYLPSKPAAETVLAKVNGVPIRESDVDRLLWDYSGYEVTQDLISYQLVQAQAKKLKVSVTAAEVQKEFDSFMTQQKGRVGPGEDLDVMLRKQGLPKSRIKLQIESNLLMNKIVDAQFKPADYIKVSTMIFLAKSEVATDEAVAVGKATDAYNQLLKGESWEKVLNSSGQIQQLIDHKGLLGWRGKEAFPQHTQEEFKTAKIGMVTAPVRTANGIQFFRVDALGVDAKGKDLEELKTVYEQSAKNNLGKKLQSEAKIEQFFGKPAQK